ncbi:hypothetical protein BDP55DRAFT_544471 [Colletotrichum godetiae]|uniref:BTB domain-containing protein n=1 Tax=Colletotrichum godetiae TaxID=1209918 RepID=A0AAJ0F029_9PEZI|nr:uncharacterized protein BDP55DRAFT_544471 [Colletotrichum godetiae]KAK1690221.1 hypothetical protein BDP55DRAFT_544471 [Colletotrichum godetiae]
MFSRRYEPPQTVNKSFSKSHKASKSSSSFSKSSGVSKHRHESRHSRRPTTATTTTSTATEDTSMSNNLTSAIVTLVVGTEQRLFAAHEDVLCASPFFQNALRANLYGSPADVVGSPASVASSSAASTKRIALPDEEPEIFSSVLEYLYKGDYYPRLVHNKRRNSWEIEALDRTADNGRGGVESTVYHHGIDGDLLKDTVIYCAAEKYGLEELKRVSLRKQGLREFLILVFPSLFISTYLTNIWLMESGIQCSTILASARYAYANTPDSDSKLRAHYLALIIRSRSTFKRSGTMQLEMFNGGTPLFFDLFVALCNHVDDISTV